MIRVENTLNVQIIVKKLTEKEFEDADNQNVPKIEEMIKIERQYSEEEIVETEIVPERLDSNRDKFDNLAISLKMREKIHSRCRR